VEESTAFRRNSLLQQQTEFPKEASDEPPQILPPQYDFVENNDNVIDALLLTFRHLSAGQKLRTAFMFFFVALMAASQYLYFLTTGNLLNLATELSDGFDVEQQFHNKLIFLVIVLIANVITYYIVALLGARLISHATARLQREITKRVLYSVGSAYTPGALANAFSANLAKAEAVWNELLYNMVFPMSCLFSAVGFFCILDVGYAMFTLAAVPMVFFCQHVLGSKATSASDRCTASSALLLGRFQNIVAIQKPAKLYQSQDFFLRDRIEEQLHRTQADHCLSLSWGNVFGAVFNTIGSLLYTITNIVLLFAHSTGKITAGEFFSLTYFVNGVIKPIEQLGLFSGRVAFYSGAIRDIEQLLKQEGYNREEVDGDYCPTSDSEEEEEQPLVLKDKLTLEYVGFRYGPDLPLVFQDVSATIPAGTYACVFGNSGCGKSTLLGLLEGFQQCADGRICMDGVDISSVSQENLRHHLGVVFQDTYILDGSIHDNIAFGYASRGRSYSREQVIKAAKDAHVHDFVETLPSKYDTVIGLEADISLSGGQLQRICGLARALLRHPELLVLDEATSALDTISEQLVIDTILKLREKGVTTVSVSHHTITAVNADSIIVLSEGRVGQLGTYDELLAETDGIFAELVHAGEQTVKD
jgi:ABC-type multidrug transport system fused ATPase/permease subunit